MRKTKRYSPGYRIYPPAPENRLEDEVSLDVWGFRDTSFHVNERGRITMSGSRYAGLSGEELPELFPWFSEAIGVTLDPFDTNPGTYPTEIPDSLPATAFLADVRATLDEDQVTADPHLRLRHGHGHTVEEMHAVKFGRLKRIPDYVVYPEEDREVAKLVELAVKHNVCLIPYGGGTNVTDALRCPENETRPIVSVDMSRMNRILWVDPYNRMACIQAGAVGRTIFQQLERYGFTIGHEPDSVEFSTMGGWVATHASGMKKNRYGNIEDLVVDITAVTPAGKLERRHALPRESIGVDPKRWFFGSEGTLGIITSAVVKIFPVPEVRKYGSVLFHDFDRGFAFLYDLQRQGNLPASVRLVDNMQFQFGQALKSKATGLTRIKKPIEKWLVTGPLGFDPEQMVALTLVFEGTAEEVEEQEKAVYKLAKQYKGFPGGAENGKRGYQLTFGIAYIRDFVMRHHILAESFETSVAWSDAQVLCANVKKRVNEVYAQKGLPGRPFISCRVTQLYQTGVCIYFYFAFYAKGVANAVEVYKEIEHEARQEILRCGGSLSHHHGVGKLRQGFLPQVLSPAAMEWRSTAKQALDPHNIFGVGNIPVADATDLLLRSK